MYKLLQNRKEFFFVSHRPPTVPQSVSGPRTVAGSPSNPFRAPPPETLACRRGSPPPDWPALTAADAFGTLGSSPIRPAFRPRHVVLLYALCQGETALSAAQADGVHAWETRALVPSLSRGFSPAQRCHPDSHCPCSAPSDPVRPAGYSLQNGRVNPEVPFEGPLGHPLERRPSLPERFMGECHACLPPSPIPP